MKRTKLESETKKIHKEVVELISTEEKIKSLSLFVDNVMKGAKQLPKEELVKLGRLVKKGRFNTLKQKGLL